MKTLNNMLETYGFKGPKHDQGTRKPGTTQPFKKFIGNSVTSKNGNVSAETTATQEFIDDHEINRVADANGNDDKLFKASNIKPLDRKKEKHGYDAKDAENVNEKKLTPAEMKKREEVAQAIDRENPNMPMSKKMAIATSTAKKVAEALDHNAKAKENVDFHHTQASDYAKEITNMLGQYRKHAKGEKHMGDYHAMDMAQVHGGLRQVHDMLNGAVNAVKPVQVTKMAESVEETKYDSILEAIEAHKQVQEEQELVDAYAAILESIYEALDTDEQKQHFSKMLESDDAFDDLVELVENVIAEENE